MAPRPLLPALLLGLCAWSAAAAQTTYTPTELRDGVDEQLDNEDFDGAIWGAYIADLESEEVLYARNSNAMLIPASNMKLVTTAAALDALGPDHAFVTRLYAHGEIRDSTLYGRLVVRGAGDPRFGGRYRGDDLARAFRGWADSLKAAGVYEVLGAVVVADDMIEDPDAYFVRSLRRQLRRGGIRLASDSLRVHEGRSSPDYGAFRRVASHRSPPLWEFVEVTNTDSNNLYSERILRTLAGYRFPSPGPVSGLLRRRTADDFLDKIGVDPQTFVIADGSGLSRSNRLTPVGITRLLREMWEHPDPSTRQAFVRSLPLGGRTGTLKDRYRSGDARSNVRAKTGYIRRVRTLSGYVTTATGRTLVFSLMCNGYTTSTRRVNRAQDAVVELLADYEGAPVQRASMRRTTPRRRATAPRRDGGR